MTGLPEGFRYEPDFLSVEEERALIENLRGIGFSEVRMHGVTAKRHVAHFGLVYGYESWKLTPGPPLPEFLVPVRDRAAAFAGAAPEEIGETLVTEYPEGAGIGWHRDAPMFGIVIAVSLAGSCRFRFQRGKGEERETRDITVQPRSVYVLSGAARTEWQHSIPSTKELRYSITFRTLRRKKSA